MKLRCTSAISLSERVIYLRGLFWNSEQHRGRSNPAPCCSVANKHTILTFVFFYFLFFFKYTLFKYKSNRLLLRSIMFSHSEQIYVNIDRQLMNPYSSAQLWFHSNKTSYEPQEHLCLLWGERAAALDMKETQRTWKAKRDKRERAKGGRELCFIWGIWMNTW